MKSKYSFVSIVIAALFFTAGIRTADAQISLGAGALYGAEEEKTGLTINGFYQFREKFGVGAGAVLWPRSAPEDARYLLTELNVEMRFIPYSANGFSFHVSGLTGYHYFGVRVKSLGETYGTSEHMTAIGYAAGITYSPGKISLTAGVRNFLTGFNQLSAGAGVQYRM